MENHDLDGVDAYVLVKMKENGDVTIDIGNRDDLTDDIKYNIFTTAQMAITEQQIECILGNPRKMIEFLHKTLDTAYEEVSELSDLCDENSLKSAIMNIEAISFINPESGLEEHVNTLKKVLGYE